MGLNEWYGVHIQRMAKSGRHTTTLCLAFERRLYLCHGERPWREAILLNRRKEKQSLWIWKTIRKITRKWCRKYNIRLLYRRTDGNVISNRNGIANEYNIKCVLKKLFICKYEYIRSYRYVHRHCYKSFEIFYFRNADIAARVVT